MKLNEILEDSEIRKFDSLLHENEKNKKMLVNLARNKKAYYQQVSVTYDPSYDRREADWYTTDAKDHAAFLYDHGRQALAFPYCWTRKKQTPFMMFTEVFVIDVNPGNEEKAQRLVKRQTKIYTELVKLHYKMHFVYKEDQI